MTQRLILEEMRRVGAKIVFGTVDYDALILDPYEAGRAGYQRVYAIPITIDDNGVERVEGLVTSQDSVAG